MPMALLSKDAAQVFRLLWGATPARDPSHRTQDQSSDERQTKKHPSRLSIVLASRPLAHSHRAVPKEKVRQVDKLEHTILLMKRFAGRFARWIDPFGPPNPALDALEKRIQVRRS